MKKIILGILSSILLIITLTGKPVNASDDFYNLHPLDETFNDDGIECKVTGYQYVKNLRPSGNKHARFLIVHCEANTNGWDPKKLQYQEISTSNIKILDNKGETETQLGGEAIAKDKLAQPPFQNVENDNEINHLKPNQTYKFDICGVVFPYDLITLDFNNGTQFIDIHRPKSKNKITLTPDDSLAMYAKEDAK